MSEGYTVTDRRGQPDRATVEPTGEITERIDGVECVFLMVNGGRKLIRKGGHDVEVLTHEFISCEVCGSQHLRVGDEKVRCARLDWQFQMDRRRPAYTTGPRTLETQQDEANLYNRSIALNLAQMSREIRRRGGFG